MRYRVVLQVSEEGYSVSVPGLPGCCSEGSTEAEALDNTKVAIAECLAVVDELGASQIVREVDVVV